MTAKHWHGGKDADGIFWLNLDVAGASTNTLSREVLDELDTALEVLEGDLPTALVIRSAKPKGFIAGADVSEFALIASEAEAIAWITRAHGIFDRLAAFKVPTVAAINGFCFGGGLELALACRYRVARSDARLGLPEVKLGIHPGFGGSVRLTRLLPVAQAMEMMLTARSLDARAARRAGLVDAIAEDRHFEAAARHAALGKLKVKRHRVRAVLQNLAPMRAMLSRILRRKTAEKVRADHYPAPFALIDLWARHGGRRKTMMLGEADSIGRLVVSETARNLTRIFFLQDRLKSATGAPTEPVKRVHVVGAGTMGGDIAAWCALQGMTVTLQDQEVKFIAPAIKRAGALAKRRARGRERDMMDRLIPDVTGAGAARADLVIEAIVEDVEVKRGLFGAMESRLKERAILATNTSSIPLEAIAEGLTDPGTLVGIHFFNPVEIMPLVEIVHGDKTKLLSTERAAAFTRAIDRLPLSVMSAPGFLVNRALMPYLMEAVTLLEEGAPESAIDAAALEFGMPMGPLEVSDRVGLDICLHVGQILTRDLGGTVPTRLQHMVDRGDKGVKTGRGFYEWKDGKPIKHKAQRGAGPDAIDRMILAMVNACVACLADNIVSDPDIVDAGLVFGAGFAPFRGGPMHYTYRRGPDEVRRRLDELADRYGDRFRPVPGWDVFPAEPADG
jgi:3-hydroxyacyl-CoA dehydrogenase/enoyl-CoA hydratase/3-hydroxybutyryl-CoA epimerase